MNSRFRFLFIFVGAVLVGATFTFPQWYRLLEPGETAEEVEALAGLAPELQPTFEALPLQQQSAYRTRAGENPQAALAMISAALQPPTVVPEVEQALPNMSGPVVVATGRFVRIDDIRWGEGDVTIYEQADGTKVLRFENFSVVNGPDLRVILSAIPNAATAATATLGGSDIDLGPLQGNEGAQNYSIPRQVALNRYNSIVIYSGSLQLVYTIAPIRVS